MRNSKIYALGSWFAFLAVLLWMTSCGSKKITSTSSEKIKDSVSVKTTVTPRDTTIVIPANYASVSANINDLSEKPLQVKSNNLTASLKKEGNVITAECKLDELLLRISLMEKLIEIYERNEKSSNELVTVPVNQTPWYLQPLVGLGALTFIVLLIMAIIYLIKKRTNTF